MKRSRGGFKLGRRLVKVFKWFIHRKPSCRTTYKQLNQSSCSSRTMSKLFKWVRSLKHGAKGLGFVKTHRGYIRVGQEPVVETKSVSVPKGHLAVYVGDKEDDTCRVLVPVIYFNHPLFMDLLREAEMVYGFNHQGGIQIPCQKSKFERVKTRIDAASGGGRCHGRWGWIKA